MVITVRIFSRLWTGRAIVACLLIEARRVRGTLVPHLGPIFLALNQVIFYTQRPPEVVPLRPSIFVQNTLK